MTARAPRLGELLLKEGKISSEQLTRALQAQSRLGGRIGTNLVELDLISILELGRALSTQRGVPEAHPRDFMSASPRLLDQFPRQLAARLQVFPLRVKDKILQLAMVDPQDHEPAGEVTFVTGLRVNPLVSPELRMVFFLEQRFGIPRPARFVEVAGVRGARTGVLPAVSVAAPAPAVTPAPAPAAGVLAATPGPARRPKRPTDPGFPAIAAPAPVVPPAGVLDPAAELELVYLDDARRSVPEDDIIVTVEPPQPSSSHTAAPVVGLVAVMGALDRATDRLAVEALAVRPVLGRPALSVLLRIKGGAALALTAAPTPIPAEEVRRLELPLSPGSLLQRALACGGLVREPAEADPLQKVISAYLRAPDPGEVCVLPIVVGDRVISILCVQLPQGARCDDEEFASLCALAEAISDAYLRLIREARARIR